MRPSHEERHTLMLRALPRKGGRDQYGTRQGNLGTASGLSYIQLFLTQGRGPH